MSSFSDVVFNTALWSGAGYFFSQLVDTPPELTVTIVAISALAKNICFIIAMKTSDLKSKKVANYAAANFLVNAVTIYAFQRFKIIGGLGVFILSALALGNLAEIHDKMIKAQNEEGFHPRPFNSF